MCYAADSQADKLERTRASLLEMTYLSWATDGLLTSRGTCNTSQAELERARASLSDMTVRELAATSEVASLRGDVLTLRLVGGCQD